MIICTEYNDPRALIYNAHQQGCHPIFRKHGLLAFKTQYDRKKLKILLPIITRCAKVLRLLPFSTMYTWKKATHNISRSRYQSWMRYPGNLIFCYYGLQGTLSSTAIIAQERWATEDATYQILWTFSVFVGLYTIHPLCNRVLTYRKSSSRKNGSKDIQWGWIKALLRLQWLHIYTRTLSVPHAM